ncbi:D-2-hydroxyacid dehydrogenase [Colwelliaceae bacterium BS250]
MRAVFLDRSTIDGSIDLAPIESQVDNVTYFEHTTQDKIIYRAQFAEIIISNKVILDNKILSQLPKLKLICVAATGTNNVDLEAAKRLGIAVCNVSSYSTTAVSQYVFALLLEAMQKTSLHIASTRQGDWQSSPIFCHLSTPINELAGKTLAIIGYGEIAQSVAKIANAFSMQIIVAERKGSTQIRDGRVSFEQAMATADIITLHCPQTPETENIINSQSLALTKKGVILINTARGGLINSRDLLSALKTKHIGYAILDVLEQEPPPKDHPLLNTNLNNLMITAHVAWGSLQAQNRLIIGIANNINSYLQGELLNRIV